MFSYTYFEDLQPYIAHQCQKRFTLTSYILILNARR